MAGWKNPFKIFRGSDKNEELDTSFNQSLEGGAYTYLSQGPEHKLIKLLSQKDRYTPITPDQWAIFSAVLYDNLGIYERAIEIHSTLTGSPIIDEESQVSTRVIDLAKNYFENVPILNEYQSIYSDMCGIDVLKGNIIRNALRDGTTFLQERFNENLEYQGVMQFKRKNFDFQYIDGHYTPRYLDTTTPQYKDGAYYYNPFFYNISFETDVDSYWGYPLIRGGKLIADIFAQLLVAIEMQGNRFGNPIELVTLSPSDENFFKEGNKEAHENLKKIIKSIREKISIAFAAQKLGKDVRLVTAIPSANIEHTVFGKDFSAFIDHDVLWKIGVLMAQTVSIPAPMLGIRVGGSGIGSEEFKYSYKILMSRIEKIRKHLDSVFTRMLGNYLIEQGVNATEIRNINVTFSEFSAMTEQEKANLRKANIEADATLLDMAEAIGVLYDEQSRDQFLEDHGLVIP